MSSTIEISFFTPHLCLYDRQNTCLDLELSVLECLTNMAVLPDWHHLLVPLLPRLLATLDTPHPALRLQACLHTKLPVQFANWTRNNLYNLANYVADF